ncbi:hypothetical protein TorRG33x02_259710 [Trema orientale]|uniref:Uncharacterized protein n=1 Tax=Trema orientale TaxID=63057 RepID=A0A2P5D787_TREOI|nr:hypothetical protein TorRG33x02_259710 [Trema orientale]
MKRRTSQSTKDILEIYCFSLFLYDKEADNRGSLLFDVLQPQLSSETTEIVMGTSNNVSSRRYSSARALAHR